MMKTQRFTALVLACVLLAALVIPVGAAAAPKLTYTQSGSTVQLTLQDLGSESVYGVQLELTISGSYSDASFTPASSTAYAPPCHRATTGDSTLVTLYLTDRAPLNRGSTLTLGTLKLSQSFTMPDAAAVTLLDRDLKPVSDRQPIPVSRQSSSSGGSSGGSRPTSAPTPSPTPTPEPTPAPSSGLPFADVKETDWFYAAAKYVHEKGMMNGTAANAFSPNVPASRAMLVTILYRLAGEPPASLPAFSDVAAGQYYAYPVGWAAGQGVVNGYEDGLFRPDGLLTREQLAAVLYRYSRAMGYDTVTRGDLTPFADRAQISPYAQEPMSWAVGTGLLSGMGDGSVAPAGYATRAQVATILMRFCENLVE